MLKAHRFEETVRDVLVPHDVRVDVIGEDVGPPYPGCAVDEVGAGAAAEFGGFPGSTIVLLGCSTRKVRAKRQGRTIA